MIDASRDITFPTRSLAARRSRISGVIRRDIAAMQHSPVRIVEIFFWPVVYLVMWGLVSSYLSANRVPLIAEALLGGAILWEVLHRASREVGLSFLEDVWTRNTLNLHVTPLTTGEYLTGLALLSLGKIAAVTLVMSGAAAVLYGFGLYTIGIALVPFMALLLALGWALAMLAMASVLRFGQGAQVVAWTLVFIIQPFVGVFYPISVLPRSLRLLANITPASYVFEGMRSVQAGQPLPWQHLAIAGLLDAVYILAAVLIYARTLRRARTTGRLARLGE
ncbi:ABC transporter permease [Nocardia terpenica]|uniref:Transport permease protein n=1 Tax=Nocardia terpenica TaxID=455432 RepID=A0A6G9YYL8_9NOCA|nr:ABC transporter permease [Nocardia terpenica]QIS18439.1 ABC transporter permease [Nocardia terpenica]